jgi:hypothetical protein
MTANYRNLTAPSAYFASAAAYRSQTSNAR